MKNIWKSCQECNKVKNKKSLLQSKFACAGFSKISRGLCFLLIMRSQHALEAEDRNRQNKAPSGNEKNPTAGIQAELLFHI
jgi:hypothetical protein